MQKHLRIFTTVWDEKYLGWFEKFCLKSLSFPKNREALDGAIWTFLTVADDQPKIEALVKASQLNPRHIQFLTLGPEFRQNPHSAGHFINQGLLMEMQQAITFNQQTLLAPPDTIFGDGSIPVMREIARQRDSVVFAIHARVLPEIENDLREIATCPQLVSLAFKHLHKTWSEAMEAREKVNSYVGGVSFRYIAPDMYSVTHRLPTPYLINWTPEDIVFFKNQLHWGIIDHLWPHECLVHTERMRVIGSSDAAFMVEITEADKNVPPLAAYHEDEPDLFWKNLSHNKVNRMFSVILRGAH